MKIRSNRFLSKAPTQLMNLGAVAFAVLVVSCCLTMNAQGETILVEAESFGQRGGWVIDQQSMDQMGSPYLMAHGLGKPVTDATTKMEVNKTGKYRVWVRTRDWAGPWKSANQEPGSHESGSDIKGYPGKFQLCFDGHPLDVMFGTEQNAWHWQDGGTIELSKPQVHLALRDQTGFNGRCDAILLTTEMDFVPPASIDELTRFRHELSGRSDIPTDRGDYDLVVVGGGIAGICSAISAARANCRVALIQNRPVLGGNNSSEVRVGLSGLIRQQPFPNLGNLVDEISPVGHWTLWDANKHPDWPRTEEVLELTKRYPEKKIHNAGPKSNYEDDKKLNAVLAEPNITLFLNTHVNAVEMEGDRINAVIGQDIRTGERIRCTGKLFADCTGDGSLGALAGADFRQGRESKEETRESLAPEVADQLVMGTSVQWNTRVTEAPEAFPVCPWAVQFDESTCIDTVKGDWDWETGAGRDHVDEIERIRDYGLRVVFGNWSVLKNADKFKQRFSQRELQWVAYIGGKRESRRLMGDVVLKQQDIVSARPFKDASVTTTWTIDLHYPTKPMCACEAFQSIAKSLKITPYPIPYRCFYSRNVSNMFMAGRNTSVTHVALGTVRVQRTTGMMGEVVGMAAAICKNESCQPRDVHEQFLADLQQRMQQGVSEHSAASTDSTH